MGDGDSYFFVFLIGQLFTGVGGGILYVVMVPYMDSNIRITNTPSLHWCVKTVSVKLTSDGHFIVGSVKMY